MEMLCISLFCWVSIIFARFLVPDIGNPSNNSSGKNTMIRVNREDNNTSSANKNKEQITYVCNYINIPFCHTPHYA